MHPRTFSAIELLEPRIAPAAFAVLAYTDRDGDDVKIRVSTPGGTSAALQTALNGAADFQAAGAGSQLHALNVLTPQFEGASISITAKRSATNGGDGLVAVGEIDGGSRRLGNVFIDGDLGRLVTSSGPGTTALQSLAVQSIGFYDFEPGGSQAMFITGNVGRIFVKEDVTGSSMKFSGGNVGSIFIGGSLLGTDDSESGSITVEGSIGTLKIGRNVIPGSGDMSGRIGVSGKTGNLTIGGSVFGPTDAADDNLGQIELAGKVGTLRIKGDVVGSLGDFNLEQGQITLGDAVGTLDLRGSLIGSRGIAGLGGGEIRIDGPAGAIRIGGNIEGSSAARTGSLSVPSAHSIFIGGDVIGGTATNSGMVILGTGTTTALSIVGDLIGGPNVLSGGISGGLTTTIRSLAIGGNLESRGDNALSGFIRAQEIDRLAIGGDVLASLEPGSTTQQIEALGSLGTVTIGGTIRGNAENTVRIIAETLGSLTVGKSANYLEVGLSNLDSTVASLAVRGTWLASRFTFAAGDGADNIFGTTDDPALPGGARARIAQIVFGGQVAGTFGGADSYLIRAAKIGSLTVAGSRVPFAPGPQSFNLGITADVVISDKL